MQVQATTTSPYALLNTDTIAVGIFEGDQIAHDVGNGALQWLLDRGEAKRTFKHLALAHPDSRRVILVGLGDRARFDAERARIAAGVALGRARELSATNLCWEVPHHVSEATVGGLVEGTLLADYRFDRYRGTRSENGSAGPQRLLISAHHDVSAPVARAAVLGAAQNRARDLGNTPGNLLTPAALAAYAVDAAARLPGVSVSALDEAEIRAAGMGAFAAVAQGSAQEARLIRLQYDGTDGASDSWSLALVGKAVTFDTGGISLKPAGKMHEMKFDMAGGAAVIEAICALAELRAPVRVLGVVGAAENMPGGGATRPGDIVTALDGTTIEVDNTDAEGRLVLADCITYAIQAGAARIIDVATLTGGIVVALGSVYTGLMSNDDAFAEQVLAAGLQSGELAWRMPLHERYAEMVKGRYAQITNLTERREASSITAAEFLHHFAGQVPWAHLDIAGTGYDAKRPHLRDKGATGVGVRLLVELATGSAA